MENPTFYDLIRALERRKDNPRDRNGAAVMSLLNRLRGKILELPDTYRCAKGFPPELFLENTVVLHMEGLSPNHAIFLLNHLTQTLMRGNEPSGRVKNIFHLDEAPLFLARQREMRYDLGEVLLYEAMRKARHTGWGISLVSQDISCFAPAVLANVNCLAIAKLLNGACVRAAGLRLGLSQDQMEGLSKLKERQFIIQTPDSPEPTLLEVPFIEKPKYDPREIEALTRERLSKVPWVPYEEQAKRKRAERPPVDEEDKEFLTELYDNPFIGFAERAAERDTNEEGLALTFRKYRARGLIGEMEPFSLGRGKPRISAQLTPAGLALINAKPLPGKGGLLHKFLVNQIKETRKHPCVMEERECDLVVFAPEGTVAYEVETDAAEEHVFVNIERDLANFPRVVVVVRNQAEQRLAKKRVKERSPEQLERIAVMTIQEVCGG